MDSDKKTTATETKVTGPTAPEKSEDLPEGKPIDEDPTPEPEQSTIPAITAAEAEAAEPAEPATSAPADLSDLTDDETVKEEKVPDVDINAPLEIEQIKKPSTGIPETNLKASLKIEEKEEKEENGQQEKSGKKMFIFGGITLAVIVLLTIGFFAFSAREAQKEEKQQEQAAVEKPAPSPTQAPKKTLERSEWSIEVLNGSGVPGTAKRIADQLTALGYQVVKTGNAGSSDYASTEVIVKNELLDKVDLLITDLKDVIKIASQSGDLKDSTASARIILGKE